MKYYKDAENNLHAIDDGFEYLLPFGIEEENEISEAEYQELINPPETPEQIISRLEGALDRHLDTVANQYRYESIRTMVTYATSEHPTFGNEGRASIKFRDAVYAYGIQCISDVQAEQRDIPTEEELIAELPLFEDFL